MHIQHSNEVFFADEEITKLGSEDIVFLKEKARCNQRKRARLCMHSGVDDLLHEMLIVKMEEAYVRPHKNLKHSKSFQIIEGFVDLVIFDEVGNIVDVIPMGGYSSGRIFYCRIPRPGYHTLLIRSPILVFKETTNGPFKNSDTVYAPWAPEENDSKAVKEFMEKLEHLLRRSG